VLNKLQGQPNRDIPYKKVYSSVW